ncbi:MAG: hypothetical protein MPJ50_01835 [Pirellulales bacterium]|nr:hypothetical protein [Pirellulales bacterium]
MPILSGNLSQHFRLATTPARYCVVGFALAVCLPQQSFAQEKSTSHLAIEHGIAFLSNEVPAWADKHNCYSCHNNGNAAQALYRAKSLGHDVPQESLADTTRWLLQPDEWKNNGGDPAFADETLANIQFAAALVTAIENKMLTQPPADHPKNTKADRLRTGEKTDRATAALRKAAELIAADQQPTGFWRIGGDKQIGAPATLGNMLATREALRALRLAEDDRFANHISKAESWLVAERPRTVFDASAQILALADIRDSGKSKADKGPDSSDSAIEYTTTKQDEMLSAAAQHALIVVRKGQSLDGGFGPYVTSMPEPFDTSIAMLALMRWGENEDHGRIGKAQKFLLSEQYAEGDWPETTRPAGNQSYAQRLSTAGWAVLALLETEGLLDSSDHRQSSIIPQDR